jgi:antagonist of KipI
MSTVHVHAPGLFTTVQDLGRPGFGAIGVSASGAADPISLRLGNRLVGNREHAPALEMMLFGGSFKFEESAVVALTGSDFGATIDGAAVEPWTSNEIRSQQAIQVGATRSGARCYLCVSGGIDVPLFLGSASTHVLSGLGGFEGRPLRKGDMLRVGTASHAFHRRAIESRIVEGLSQRDVLRVTPGPQAGRFSDSAIAEFYATTWRVGEQSNRMGLRLEGAMIEGTSGSMITEGVSLGAIQMPPNGAPIILFVEQQTTGGYPKIANVIAADLHRIGQLRPRDEIQFELVTFETARALLIKQEQILASEELFRQ